MSVRSSKNFTGAPFFFYALVVLGVVLAGFYGFAGFMVFKYGYLTKDFGWEHAVQADGVYVTRVDPNGPAAGKLQVGDQIVKLQGENRLVGGARERSFWLVQRGIPAGSTYSIHVVRYNPEIRFELHTQLIRDSRHLGPMLCFLVVSLSFFIVGLMIGLLKPEDRVARLASIASLSMAAIPYFKILEPIDVFFTTGELGFYYLTISIFPFYLAFAYHFYYRFPHEAPLGRGWTTLLCLLYTWSTFLWMGYRLLDYLTLQPLSHALSTFSDNHTLFVLLERMTSLFYLVGLVAICSVITRNYRLVQEIDQRRRIKWIVYSTAAGVIPFVGLILLELAVPEAKRTAFTTGGTYQGLSYFSELAPMAIPVTLGFTIIKHRVFDIQVVIRRGVQYLLAKNALRAFFMLPLIGFGVAVISNPNRTVKEILFQNPFLFALFVAGAVGLRFRQQVGDWIDRKFFREAYNQEQIMLRLIREMTELESFGAISKLVNREIDAALHPKTFYVFQSEQHVSDQTRAFTSVYSTGRLISQLAIPDDFRLLKVIEQEEQILAYPFSRQADLPGHELEWLEELGINLIVPMMSTDHHLMGLLLLGEKKSEEPYSPTDCKLLQVIAGQIAVVLENSRLKERVNQEQTIRQKVLERFEEQNINVVKECPKCGYCYDSNVANCARDNEPLVFSLAVERVLEGKYRLERQVGKGGMGAVYEAQDIRLNRKVAVKIILGNYFGDQTALKRFEREARSCAKLNHPNIIAVYDYGRTKTDGAYLVMELVQGTSLRSELKRLGSLPAERTARIFTQLCEGIKVAHAAGVVHRDLKPDNILILNSGTSQEQIKVLDFGLAKTRITEPDEVPNLTKPGVMMGTVGYMSPEQFNGEEVDDRSDVFTIGVMAVEVLTGELPFKKRTLNEYLSSLLFEEFHLTGEPPEIKKLDQILQRCLAKEPNERYQSVRALQLDLIPALERFPAFKVLSAEEAEASTLHDSNQTLTGENQTLTGENRNDTTDGTQTKQFSNDQTTAG